MAIQHLKRKRKERAGLRGIYHFTLADGQHPSARALIARINELRAYQKNTGLLMPETGRLIQAFNRLFATQRFVYENLVPDVALTAIMNNIGDSGGSPTDILANYVAVGTGTNAPAAGNTQLQTETYRNVIASRTSSSNKAFLTGFYDATETTGAFKEAGVFSGASGTPNSGTLLSRVAIDVNKDNTKTLTVDWEMTLTYVP